MSQASIGIQTIFQPLAASVRVPGSKSLTNRALMVASLAQGTTILTNALYSDDSRYFTESLQRLGFDVKLFETPTMRVTGLAGRIPADGAELFVGNAGTAARFLMAMLTLGNGHYLLDGDERMRQRPVQDLVSALGQLGAQVNGDHLPVRIQARGLAGGKAVVNGDISSQFLSGLLLTAPYARNPVALHVMRGLNSKPYIDLTLAVMADFGVKVERDGYDRFTVPPQCYRSPGPYPIEPDASAASYFFAAPAICGGTVRVEGLTRSARQGDIAFLDVLTQMGCTVEDGPAGVSVTGNPGLRGVSVNLGDISDTTQTLAAIAPFASTPTTIHGIASSRMKETDRVAAICTELTRLGVRVDEYADGMTIYPCQDIHPAEVHTYQDHRMAMAFSLIGLRVPGITILDPGCVSKTFPEFFQVLSQLQP